jgi:hypothetical protein
MKLKKIFESLLGDFFVVNDIIIINMQSQVEDQQK